MTIPEDIKNLVYRKYSRPKKLSDPGSDFSQEELDAIIRKVDADLTDTDLTCIFQSFLPAGEYWESVYFLPLALKHICDTDHDGAPTLCENLLIWIGKQKENLEKDELYDRLLVFFERLFAELTSTFTLHDNYPKNCNRTSSIFDTLNSCSLGSGDLLFRRYLGNTENYEQAAWLVFFLKWHLYGSHRNSAFLKDVANDKTLLKKAYDLIVAKALNDEKLLSFWDEYLTSCGIW
jgi:hypothetical protein